MRGIVKASGGRIQTERSAICVAITLAATSTNSSHTLKSHYSRKTQLLDVWWKYEENVDL